MISDDIARVSTLHERILFCEMKTWTSSSHPNYNSNDRCLAGLRTWALQVVRGVTTHKPHLEFEAFLWSADSPEQRGKACLTEPSP